MIYLFHHGERYGPLGHDGVSPWWRGRWDMCCTCDTVRGIALLGMTVQAPQGMGKWDTCHMHDMVRGTALLPYTPSDCSSTKPPHMLPLLFLSPVIYTQPSPLPICPYHLSIPPPFIYIGTPFSLFSVSCSTHTLFFHSATYYQQVISTAWQATWYVVVLMEWKRANVIQIFRN